MNSENITDKIINKEDSSLKELIIDFVGNKTNPENDEVTIDHIAEVFALEFPEFIVALAEENWISGYTQALSDVDFVKDQMNKNADNKNNKT